MFIVDRRARRAIGRLPTLLAVFLAIAALAPRDGTLAIAHVNVVDVVNGRILTDTTVAIGGATIVSATPHGTPAADARVVDGRGKYLIPGLWDMHAHMQAAGEPWLPLYVANGVTGIRDMGSDLDVILHMRDATASGRLLGPRIFAAGPILDDAPGDWPFRMRVKTADDGRAAVQLLARRGVDLIKVHDHTPRDAFFAIAEEARRQHLPLAGHVPSALSVPEVIDAGQTDIEHLSNLQLWKPCSGGETYRPEACRSFFEMLARRHIWQTPTIAAWVEIATIGTAASNVSADRMAYATSAMRKMWAGNQSLFATPEVIRSLRAGADVGARVTSDLAKAGVPILAGCDGMIAGFCVGDELAAMVHGGMTPAAALQTATLNPARYFGLESTIGGIAAGKTANLVLLDANPLTDITNVRRVNAVILGGRLLERSELDRVLADVRHAARQ
jgi:imidazolonepropionase-like amidohydrolase